MEVKRAGVLGKLAKRFCEMIDIEDVWGEKKARGVVGNDT